MRFASDTKLLLIVIIVFRGNLNMVSVSTKKEKKETKEIGEHILLFYASLSHKSVTNLSKKIFKQPDLHRTLSNRIADCWLLL